LKKEIGVTNSNSTEFTSSDGRKFAFPVGTAFLLLSAVLFWREKETALRVTASLGGALYLAGLLFPGKLGPVYRGWMRMALVISKVTTPIFMSVVYFLVLTPTGLIMRIVGRRPMTHPLSDGSFWHSTADREHSDLRRQF
jgi:saxitoxin biosynthesis operon SxtJ-like protein